MEFKEVVGKLNKIKKTLRARVEHSGELHKVLDVLDQSKKTIEKISKELTKEVQAYREYFESQRQPIVKPKAAKKAQKKRKAATPAHVKTAKKKAVRRARKAPPMKAPQQPQTEISSATQA